MNKQTERAFVGGYITPQQAAKVKALAALRGETVSGLLRYLIDDAAAKAVAPTVPMHSRGAEVVETQHAAAAP